MKDAMRTAGDIVNKCSQDDNKKILVEFDKFLERMRKKHICAILPETRIAEYCLGLYNDKASDKAVIRFVEKPDEMKIDIEPSWTAIVKGLEIGAFKLDNLTDDLYKMAKVCDMVRQAQKDKTKLEFDFSDGGDSK
jgi:hypothetical protein